MTDFARAWVWVAVAVWAVIALATCARGIALLAGPRVPVAARPQPW